MRRVLSVFVVCGVLGALPATASADTGPLCPMDSTGPFDYQRWLAPYLVTSTLPSGQQAGGQADQAARAALGAQFAGGWLDTPRQGWSIAYAPGPLDAVSGRAAIRAELAARVTPAEVPWLDGQLTLLPTPYSEADLKATFEDAKAVMGQTDIVSSAAIGCSASDAWRIEIRIADARTPAVEAQAQALFGRFGNKVFLIYGAGRAVATPGIFGGPATQAVPPVPPRSAGPLPAAPRVGDYVALPRAGRCVRGRTVGVKAARRAELASVRLRAGKRHAVARPGHRARLKLAKRGATRVTVTVRLRDGRTIAQTLTFRRC